MGQLGKFEVFLSTAHRPGATHVGACRHYICAYVVKRSVKGSKIVVPVWHETCVLLGAKQRSFAPFQNRSANDGGFNTVPKGRLIRIGLIR